jgi:large repetitive protein
MSLFEYRPGKGSVRAGLARLRGASMTARSSRRRLEALIETLEHRTLLSITSITVNAINPTEGTPLGSAANPVQIGNFDVNNFIGLDESSQYSAVINWGDGSQSAGLGPVTIQFVADLGNGDAEYGVYSYHTYALATTSSNPDTLTIGVADNTGPGTLQSQSGPVQVNSTPLQNSYTPTTINATIGTPLTNVTVGQFIDTNPLAVASNYAVSVNWGDGQFSAGTVVPYKTSTQLGGTGVEFTIEASHTYTSGGSFTAAALISAIGGAQLTETTPISVTGSSLQQITAAPISAVVGVPFTGTVASFTDPNPSDTASEFSATINWGNGSSTAGTVQSVGSGAFIVTAVDPVSHNGFTYTNVGTYNVTISVTGPNNTKFTAFTTATVADAPITATGLTLGLAPNLIYTFPPFSGEVATFTSGNPNATISDFTATINWGDGTVSPGTISIDPTMAGVFDVSGTHQYAPSSTPYQAIITIDSKFGSTATAFTTITITDTPITPGTGTPISIAATKGVPFTLEVGTFTDANPGALPSQYATTINWGDGTSTSSGVVGKEANGTFTVTGTHTYANVSGATPYAITVTIADIAGTSPGTATDTATATVSDAPLFSQGSPINGVAGIGLTPSPITVATFTDSDPNGIASDYSAVINWGDNTPTTVGTITQTGTSPNGSTFSVGGAHTYDSPGDYQTTVTITETGGSKTVAIGSAVIADAPLSTSPSQPTVSTTEATVFSGPVASYTSANPTETVSDFNYVTIDWGDGTPLSLGTITQPAGPGTAFIVSGKHTYATAGVSSGIGQYPITVAIHDLGGSTLNVVNTANVADVPLIVTGKLNPASDSGVSNSDDITAVVQPNFIGTTNQPNATVNLYATVSGGRPVLIGQGVSNANDAWSITSDQALATGTYVITAIAVDQYGHTDSSDTTIVPDLVIDAVPPVVTAATFDRFDDTVTVTYQDNLSGLDYASIGNGSFYHLSAKPLSPKVPVPKLLLPTGITITPAASPASPVTVTVVFNHGHTVRGGSYLIVINSGTGDNGVQDIAGNALDGNFYGTFPTGDSLAGGNFAASISTFHNNITLAPVPVQDGYVAPGAVTIDPPSSVAKTAKKVRLVESKASVKLVTQSVKKTHVHDLAMGALTSDKKAKRDQS